MIYSRRVGFTAYLPAVILTHARDGNLDFRLITLKYLDIIADIEMTRRLPFFSSLPKAVKPRKR